MPGKRRSSASMPLVKRIRACCFTYARSGSTHDYRCKNYVETEGELGIKEKEG